MITLNFYPYYEDLLRRRSKTTTFRWEKPEFKPNDEVMITIGWTAGRRKSIHLGRIVSVYRKRIKDLTKADFAGESPDCQTPKATALVLSSIYRRRIKAESRIWVVKFEHLANTRQIKNREIPFSEPNAGGADVVL